MTTIVTNGSVFLDGKKVRDVTVELTDDRHVLVYRTSNRDLLADYTVIEDVDPMAWDVVHPQPRVGRERSRLVVQNGCGCGGQRKVTPYDNYSGALRR